MKATLGQLEEIKNWHKITCKPGIDFSQVIEWCLDHDSPYRFYCYNGPNIRDFYNDELILKFESREDLMIFAFRWLGL